MFGIFGLIWGDSPKTLGIVCMSIFAVVVVLSAIILKISNRKKGEVYTEIKENLSKPVTICNHCGHPIIKGNTNCTNCGQAIYQDSTQQNNLPPPPSSPPTEYSPPPPT